MITDYLEDNEDENIICQNECDMASPHHRFNFFALNNIKLKHNNMVK